MTNLEPRLLSGITFDWVVVRELRFADNFSKDTFGAPLRDLQVNVQVQSQVGEDQRLCRTLVRVTLHPAAAQPDQFEAIVAAVEGQFSVQSTAPSVQLATFARIQAPAIIMPFVREAIASATSKSRFGQVLLPPINVIALMEAEAAAQLSAPAGQIKAGR